MKIDTGASYNVMSKQAYDVLNARQPTDIRLCKTKLESYGGHRLTVQGKASLTAEYNRMYSPVDYVIGRGNAPTILGLQSSVELGLVVSRGFWDLLSWASKDQSKRPLISPTANECAQPIRKQH